jgi:hypothetical protein
MSNRCSWASGSHPGWVPKGREMIVYVRNLLVEASGSTMRSAEHSPGLHAAQTLVKKMLQSEFRKCYESINAFKLDPKRNRLLVVGFPGQVHDDRYENSARIR